MGLYIGKANDRNQCSFTRRATPTKRTTTGTKKWMSVTIAFVTSGTLISLRMVPLPRKEQHANVWINRERVNQSSVGTQLDESKASAVLFDIDPSILIYSAAQRALHLFTSFLPSFTAISHVLCLIRVCFWTGLEDLYGR